MARNGIISTISGLYELKNDLNIATTDYRAFQELFDYNMVDSDGTIRDVSQWDISRKPKFHLYQCGEGMRLYDYNKQLLHNVLGRLPIIDVTNRWNAPELVALAKPGRWIALQAAFYFKSPPYDQRAGRPHETRVHRSRNGIRIDFIIDRWNATSISSFGTLAGYKTCYVVLCVRSCIKTLEGGMRLGGSCLAIGTQFADVRADTEERPPPSRWREIKDDEFEDDVGFDDDEED